MTGGGRPRLNKVLAALRGCAPDLLVELKKHRYWLHSGGKTFRDVPKGSGHGGDDPEIHFRLVEKACRMLGISLECVEEKLGRKR